MEIKFPQHHSYIGVRNRIHSITNRQTNATTTTNNSNNNN